MAKKPDVQETRTTRYSDLLPLDNLPNVTVIGVGAIGRQVALQLLSMDLFDHLHLWDHDTVDLVNVGPQGYPEPWIGRYKTECILAEGQNLNLKAVEAGRLHTHTRKWDPKGETTEAVFCCVDSMEVREEIWRSIGLGRSFWCDGRMSAEVMRVVTANDTDAESSNYYGTTLFDDKDAQGGNCTAKSTLYCASICAGLMVANYAKWLREWPIERDFMFNLASTDLFPIVEGKKDADNLVPAEKKPATVSGDVPTEAEVVGMGEG